MHHEFNFGDEKIIYHNGKYYNMSNINKNKNVSSGGLGIVSVAQIVFIILKLCKLIDWEWWVVLSPTWGSAALVVIGLLLIFLIGVVIGLFKYLGVIK